jgi:diguanylate cyclase (GGDEF)-like protein
MRIYDRDFRYLLVNLVPHHRLSPGLRRDVDRALRSGDTAGLRRESVRALEQLCEMAYFERTGVRTDDGSVVVGYRRRGGRFQLSVALPRGEWEDLSEEPRAPEIVLSGDEHDQPATGSVATRDFARVTPLPVPLPSTPAHTAPDTRERSDSRAAKYDEPAVLLPDIIRSFAISDRSTPVHERLELLLETIERWLEFSSVRLDVIENTLTQGGGTSRRVFVVSEEELRANGVVGEAVASGSRSFVRRTDAPANAPGAPEQWDALAVSPIFAMGSLVGALSVYLPRGAGRAAAESQIEIASDIVRQALEFHHHFESLTSIDALTGVYNRQFYDRQMPVEIERAMRSGNALSMLLLDIDDFKRINDELGHKKGDEALVTVADIIRRNLRKIDLAFRYGGEEIVVLLPGTPEFEAVHTAERLRRVIHQHRSFRDARGAPRQVTVSVGVAVYPDTAKSADQLFVQADEAMYRAKQRGKNQVVLYSSG